MMRISIDDTDYNLAITVSASGGYNPDCMRDLQARAMESYREATARRHELADALTDPVVED